MSRVGSIAVPFLVLVAAAMLEVGGDAVVRQGLRGRAGWLIAVGCAMLAAYGVVVNLVPWDLSRLLGTYVAVFAVVSVLAGRFWFGEDVNRPTWLGLGLIVLGAVVIQVGRR